jgi:hypothetical protein
MIVMMSATCYCVYIIARLETKSIYSSEDILSSSSYFSYWLVSLLFFIIYFFWKNLKSCHAWTSNVNFRPTTPLTRTSIRKEKAATLFRVFGSYTHVILRCLSSKSRSAWTGGHLTIFPAKTMTVATSCSITGSYWRCFQSHHQDPSNNGIIVAVRYVVCVSAAGLR